MTNSPHTPGPWSYNRDEGGMHGHVISTGDYIICELPDAGDGASPDTEANARMIAAAPEMLEALEEAEYALRLAADQYAADKGRRSVILDGRRELVRAAINKAK
jgi:hypothetical protein